LLRDADLPARRAPHRLRALLLHVLDVPRASDALPGGSLRGPRGARPRGRPGAAPRARADRGAAALRQDGVGGPRLEHALDPLLREARGRAAEGVDPDAAHRRPAGPLKRIAPFSST